MLDDFFNVFDLFDYVPNGVWLVILIVLSISVPFSLYEGKEAKTKRVVQEESVAYEKGKHIVKNDAWGNEFEYSVVETKYKTLYIVRSSGKDKRMNTDDDITATQENKKLAKMAGRSLAKGTVDFGKGIINGITGKDKAGKEE